MADQTEKNAEPGAPEKEIEVIPEMVDAGELAILERLGGYDLGGYFSVRQLAIEVYRAMAIARHQACRFWAQVRESRFA